MAWVIGDAKGKPWLLFLEPRTTGECDRAISWQRVGQGQHDPADYWEIINTARLKELMPTMGRMPYTEAAFDEMRRRLEAGEFD